MSDLVPRHRRALVIASVYALFGAVWILVSDRVLELMSTDIDVLTRFQTWKGWAYVAVTAVLIYLLVRGALEAQAQEEQRRRDAEDLTRLVLDTIPGMVFWKDRESRYLGGNRVALREAGLANTAALIGLTDADLPWKAHAAQLRARDLDIIEGRVSRMDYEIVVQTAGGRERDEAVTKLPLHNAAGEITGVMVYADDLTERRRAERQLRDAQKLQVIGELTSGVTHDFKNVLSVIISNAELMDSMLPADAVDARAAAADILAVSRNAAGMVRKLLSFARQGGVSVTPVDLGEQVAAAVPLLTQIIPGTIHLDPATPLGLPRVMADTEALDQILVNLVSNARDAMPDGGTIEVRLFGPVHATELTSPEPGTRVVLLPDAASQDRLHVGVTVRDSGIGMSPDVVERIFEPFYSTRVGGAGTGLGLSMVHGLVSQQHGIITVRSTVGQGTTFGVYFPAESAAGIDRPPEVAPGVPASMAGQTILLVDDQAELRRVGSRVLRRLGYEVLEAESGAEALEIFQREKARIGLVLTDLVMPEMNGLELVARIRELSSDVPIALSSGDPNLAEKAGAANYGAIPMIAKPWTMQDLGDGVRALLRPPG